MRKLWESIFYPNLSVGGAAQPIKVHQLACYSVCAKGTELFLDTQSLYDLCPLKIKLSCVPFAAPADSSKHHQIITMSPALGISWSGGAHCAGRGSGAVLGTLACCHWWRWSRQGTATSPTLSITLVNTGTRWTSECDGAVNIYTNCSPTISRPARSRCGYSGQVQCYHMTISLERIVFLGSYTLGHCEGLGWGHC